MSYELDCDLALLSDAELLKGIEDLEESAQERDDVLVDAIELAERSLFAMKEERADVARSYEWWVVDIDDEIARRAK